MRRRRGCLIEGMSNPTMRHESHLDAARQRPCEGADAASTRAQGSSQDFAQGNKLCHVQATTMACGPGHEGMPRLPRLTRVRGTPQCHVQANMTGCGIDHEEAPRLPLRGCESLHAQGGARNSSQCGVHSANGHHTGVQTSANTFWRHRGCLNESASHPHHAT